MLKLDQIESPGHCPVRPVFARRYFFSQPDFVLSMGGLNPDPGFDMLAVFSIGLDNCNSYSIELPQ